MESMISVKILDEAVCDNAFGKDMHSFVLVLAMGK